MGNVGSFVNLLLGYLRPDQRAGCSTVGSRPSPLSGDQWKRRDELEGAVLLTTAA